MEFVEIDANLPGKPGFDFFPFKDINPSSKRKKFRMIGDPNPAMRIVHGRLMHVLRQRGVKFPYATGGVIGSSPLRSLNRHRMKQDGESHFNRYFFLLDLKDAFPSVSGAILAGHLSEVLKDVPEEQIREFLSAYCLLKGKNGLITGAPASPYLFNLYAHFQLDIALAEVCERMGLTYTRYIDDIVLSHLNKPIGRHKRKIIRATIEKAGFNLSNHKLEVLDLNKGEVFINGIGLRRNGETFLPGHMKKSLRGLLHVAITRPEEVDLHMVHVIMGKMSPFIHHSNLWWPNRSEAKIIELYGQFRQVHRDKIRKKQKIQK